MSLKSLSPQTREICRLALLLHELCLKWKFSLSVVSFSSRLGFNTPVVSLCCMAVGKCHLKYQCDKTAPFSLYENINKAAGPHSENKLLSALDGMLPVNMQVN